MPYFAKVFSCLENIRIQLFHRKNKILKTQIPKDVYTKNTIFDNNISKIRISVCM